MDCKVIISARALLLAEAEATGRLPQAGRMVPEFKTPEIRERVFCSIRIVYRVDEAQRRVVIARFWHGARGKPEIGTT